MLPKDFHFGSAIASYQVEGAYKEGNKDESIWDRFTHQIGNIADNSNGDVADDFYHRYEQDLDLAKELGIDDFRFSLAWTRVVKESGEPNRNGVIFYQHLIEAIEKRGRKPVRTIYHWDRPCWFLEKGGFLNRSCLKDWENYRKVVSKFFAPMRDEFISFNEPQCFLSQGFHKGRHAPNFEYGFQQLAKRAHHVLLCHALAAERIHEANPKANVGFVNTRNATLPKSDNPLLREKRKELFFSIPRDASGFNLLSLYSDPIYLGRYPEGYDRIVPGFDSFVYPKDRERRKKGKPKTCDCNIYTGNYFDLDKEGNLLLLKGSSKEEDSDLFWLKKRPLSLYYAPFFRYERYHLPIRITENGGCYKDTLTDGKIHDGGRISFLSEYLKQVERTISKGIPIIAYYYWSLRDNFEWAEGYQKRFGLVYIDYRNNLKRIKKDSFYLYQKIIQESKRQ